MTAGVKRPVVGIVMGSDSDWATLEHAARQLGDFNIAYEANIVSAHRTPDAMFHYASTARGRGLRCIIAGAGGSAHLPGMIAAKTIVPVLGVPVPSRHLQGLDSLLSIVQMPRGIPVATFAVGEAGAINAALFAISLLAVDDAVMARKLATYRRALKAKVRAMKLPPLKR
jgi:5-(carboxyamino)imidazole ribonucleotide mutase